MSPRRMRLILAIAGVTITALAITLAVALSQGGTAAPTPTVTVTQPAAAPTTPPADGGSYSTPQDIAIAAGESLPCADVLPNIAPEEATSEITCDGGNVVIGIYDNYGSRNLSTDAALIARKTVLAGRNWTIATDDSTLIAAAKLKIGGRYMTHACLDKPDSCDYS